MFAPVIDAADVEAEEAAVELPVEAAVELAVVVGEAAAPVFPVEEVAVVEDPAAAPVPVLGFTACPAAPVLWAPARCVPAD